MATIRARKQADGSRQYTAIDRIRRGKTIVHREYKTFALRTAAASWAKHRRVCTRYGQSRMTALGVRQCGG